MEIEKPDEADNIQVSELNGSSKTNKGAETKVRVALRVRPPIAKEILNKEPKCVECYTQTSQILMGKDRTFNFDFVFDEHSRQEEVYEKCAKDLVISCLNGYNTTILAYGQTGSGKTFTMGSSATYNLDSDDVGIIPRVMKELFAEIDRRASKSEFLVRVSFLEIYNEDIQDLLDDNNTRIKINSPLYSKSPITIREEKDGSISVYGTNEEKVTSYEEMIACLERGSLHRVTASTLMNETSSRSHAIFTISIEQHQIEDLYNNNGKQPTDKKGKQSDDAGFTTAKFHFVDLAGSERIKKTGASGSILREGININRGLLALGNVISALTDDTGKVSHVPYRESKLTRMLQDSLGGNSRTVMIACISPSESNYDESLNTLKYASRARNIRNKPVINRDPQSTLISQLKQQVFDLQGELLACKRLVATNMKDSGLFDAQSMASIPSLISENLNNMRSLGNREDMGMKEEVKSLKVKLFQKEKELAKMNGELQQTKMSLNESNITMYSLQRERDLLKIIQERYKKFVADNGLHLDLHDDSQLMEVDHRNLMEEYASKIDKLKQELKERERTNQDIQKEYDALLRSASKDHELLLKKTNAIQSLTSQLKKAKKQIKKLQEEKNRNGNEMEMESLENGMEKEGGFGVKVEDNGNLGGRVKMEEGYENANMHEEESTSSIEFEEEDDLDDKEFEVSAQAARDEILLVDGTLNEKEELLKNITQNQILLEKNLVEEMKHQYYHKIRQLEDELKLLGKQRDEAVLKSSASVENEKNKVMTTYKQKMSEMENKIKEYKHKEREQQNLIKLVDTQRSKIDQLDEEIKKMRVQKTQLHKKMREETEKFEKMRNARQKELQDIKKKNMEKDAMINKLKTEHRRKELMYKKKAEELLSRCMSKELLKQIGRTGPHANKRKGAKQPILANNTMTEVTGSNMPEIEEKNTEVMQEQDATELVDFCTEKLMEHMKLSYEIEKEEESLKETEIELENERNKYSQILLARDSMEMEKKENANDIELEQTLTTKIQEHELELNEIYTRIENIEEKLEFQLNKLKALTQALSLKPPLDAEQLLIHNKRISNSPINFQIILRCLLGKHISSSLEIVRQREKMNHLSASFAELKKKLEETEQRARFAELQYEINLTKLTKEYEKNQMLLIQQEEFEKAGEDIDAIEEEKDSPNPVANGGLGSLGEALNNELNQKGSQPTIRPLRHRRGLSGMEMGMGMGMGSNSTNHSRGNSIKMIESPLRRADSKGLSLGQLPKRGAESIAEQNKRLEKTNSDLTKKLQASEKSVETLKRKCEVLQTKYDSFKKENAKEKFIGVEKGEFSSTNGTSIPIVNPMNGDQTNSVGFGAENFARQGAVVTLSTASSAENSSFPQLGTTRSEKLLGPAFDPMGSMSLLNFKDKRREEKRQKLSSKHVLGDVFSSSANFSNENSTSNTIIDELGLKKKASTGALPTMTKNLALNSNVSQVFPVPAQKSANASITKDYSNFPEIEENKTVSDFYQPSSLLVNKIEIEEPEIGAGVQDYLAQDKENLDEMMGGGKAMDYNNTNWSCCVSIEAAHSGGVYSMTSHDNMLYSSGNKSLKVWSLEKIACIGELNANNASIKCMAIWPEKKVLATACDKVISIWDLNSFQVVATLKGHKDEIKALHFTNNMLVSAGKGSVINAGILTWDLRNTSPLEEREKNQDVFSLASHAGILYYGSRNHQVRRVNLQTLDSLPAFEPPHYDVVTSLTIVNDHLVSGSRDKNLRLWGLDQANHNLKHTSYAHQDWISVTESNSMRNMVMSGSRDGTVKIWNVINDKKLRCATDINAHTQIVTSISKIFDESDAMFATASMDKAIKIWRPLQEDSADLSSANQVLSLNNAAPGVKHFRPNGMSSEDSPGKINPKNNNQMNLE